MGIGLRIAAAVRASAADVRARAALWGQIVLHRAVLGVGRGRSVGKASNDDGGEVAGFRSGWSPCCACKGSPLALSRSEVNKVLHTSMHTI